MYRNICESTWRNADGYRTAMDMKLKTEPPGFLYAYYKGFTTMLKADEGK